MLKFLETKDSDEETLSQIPNFQDNYVIRGSEIFNGADIKDPNYDIICLFWYFYSKAPQDLFKHGMLRIYGIKHIIQKFEKFCYYRISSHYRGICYANMGIDTPEGAKYNLPYEHKTVLICLLEDGSIGLKPEPYGMGDLYSLVLHGAEYLKTRLYPVGDDCDILRKEHTPPEIITEFKSIYPECDQGLLKSQGLSYMYAHAANNPDFLQKLIAINSEVKFAKGQEVVIRYENKDKEFVMVDKVYSENTTYEEIKQFVAPILEQCSIKVEAIIEIITGNNQALKHKLINESRAVPPTKASNALSYCFAAETFKFYSKREEPELSEIKSQALANLNQLYARLQPK